MSISALASTAILLVTILPNSTAQTTELQCLKCENIARSKAPKYRVARKTRLTTGGLIVYVSIRGDQFTKDALSALACRLAQDFSEHDLLVQVFDNFDSARRFLAPWEQEKPAGWQKHVQSWRATYSRDVQKHENWIAWYLNPEKTQQDKIDICPAERD